MHRAGRACAAGRPHDVRFRYALAAGRRPASRRARASPRFVVASTDIDGPVIFWWAGAATCRAEASAKADGSSRPGVCRRPSARRTLPVRLDRQPAEKAY